MRGNAVCMRGKTLQRFTRSRRIFILSKRTGYRCGIVPFAVVRQEFSVIGRMVALLRRVGMRPSYLIFPLALSLAAAVFEGVGMSLLIPLIQGFFIKDFSFAKELSFLGHFLTWLPESITKADRWLFAALIGIFVVATLLKNILKYCSLISLAHLGLRASHHLRKLLFTRYLSFGKLYFDTSHIGHHSAIMSHFAQQALTPLLTIGRHVNALFSIIASLVILSVISWQLTLFALPLLVLLHLAVQRLINMLRELSHSLVASINALSQKTIEILSTIPLVKYANMERTEQERFTNISDKQARLDFRKSAIQNLLLPLQEVLTLGAILLLFAGMLYLMVRSGVGTAPSFIVYFYLVLNAASKFGTLTGFQSSMAGVAAPLSEVERILDDTGKYFVPSGPEEFTGLKNSIEFRKASFVFPNGNAVIRDLSFSIPKGRMTAIVGPTGAGKTTIINLLLRFYDSSPGEIFLDSKDIRVFDLASLRRHIAFVSQDTLLLHDTLRGNITYGIENVSDERLQQTMERARLAEFVQGLPEGLMTLIGDRGVKLSGGEKQRVAIARALLKDADILFLDEATSSLDSRTERLIQEAIDEAVQGRTSIVIAHRLSTIKHADQIVVLDKGSLTEKGNLEELLAKKGLFSSMWNEQKFVS